MPLSHRSVAVIVACIFLGFTLQLISRTSFSQISSRNFNHDYKHDTATRFALGTHRGSNQSPLLTRTPRVPVSAPSANASSSEKHQRLTIVLMSYPKSSRFHLLQRIIEKCIKWTSLAEEVLLVWNGNVGEVPPNIAALEKTYPRLPLGDTAASLAYVPFSVLPQEANRVDNRWRIGSRIATDAVLNMDDDVDLDFVGASCMFHVWLASPSSIVAVDVRSHFAASHSPYGEWGYSARDQSQGYKKYSIALPRALLSHRDYYLAYDAAWKDASLGLRSIVDELLCDDIAFNFVVGQHAPADVPTVIYAKAKYRPFPESHSGDAMFNKPGMKPKRQKCVNRLAAAFNGMLLRHREWHVLCEVDG